MLGAISPAATQLLPLTLKPIPAKVSQNVAGHWGPRFHRSPAGDRIG